MRKEKNPLCRKVDTAAVGPAVLTPNGSRSTHTRSGLPFTRGYGEADGVA